MIFFSSNIKFLRKRKGRTQDDTAYALKLKRSTLSGYENEVAQPGIKTLIAFSEYFNITIDTLIKVDLQKLSMNQLSQLEKGFDVYFKGSNLRVLVTTVDHDNNENVELVPEKAKAGYQRGFADPEYIKDLPLFHLPFLPQGKKFRTFEISGDSMLPIPDGAWITAEFIQDWTEIKSGEAYIILTLNDGIVFKIAENKLKNDKILTVHSLNPTYKPYDINGNEIKEIWKFSNFISKELPQAEIPSNNLINTISSLQQDIEKLKKRML
ncbi:MAG: LexA family transcriptional regulator [Bacteroidales bacterium]|jgi:transcriptional regulator with XRE-family HTH domain|nr:LexA family transcriptional regulator [Bacteroidales bacterium]